MRVQMRMNHEMNRRLPSDSDLSLADYHVRNALTDAPGGRLQGSDLAALIGWERSRVSRQLRRLRERSLAQRAASEHDGGAADAILTKAGRSAIEAAAPGHVAFGRRMFFDPLPDELLAPLTEALEHVYVNINFKSSLPPAPWRTRANGSGSEEPVRSTVCAICFAAQAGSQLETVYGPLQGKTRMVALDALGLTVIGLIPLFQN
jgi:DNA-binding MarR family transcriptional regulator